MMRTIATRVAITGGAGEGKSVVRRYLAEQGFPTLDSDDIVDELWTRPTLREEIAAALGLSDNFSKPDVAQRIFGDDQARRTLNAIFHEEVVQEIFSQPPAFVEVPLLIEAVLHPRFDAVWTVSCGSEMQIERLQERGWSPARIEGTLDSQVTSKVRRVFADCVIRTDETLENVYRQIDKACALTLS